jgi:hypothetical protein
MPGSVGVAFTGRRQRTSTLIVIWVTGHAYPWLLLTDLAPSQVGGVVRRENVD